MSKIFTKTLFILFFLTISNIILTSCNAKYIQTKSKTAKPYEINWYIVANSQPKDTNLIEEEINKIILPKINAKIKLHVIGWAEWDTKIGISVASSEYMDIIFTADWWYYVESISKDAFLPLDDLINENCPNLKKYFSQTEINSCKYQNIILWVANKKRICN